MPPKYKKGGANNRDRRHENGLAPPAKQIKRQRSDGHLNGHADKLLQRSGSPSLAQPVTPSDSSLPPSDDPYASADADADPMAPDHPAVLAAFDPQSPSAAAARDTPGEFPSLPLDAPAPAAPDSGDAPADRSLFSTIMAESATTVIAPWSIVDIVAILMVLMQLPSSVLTLVNVVFAFLTFGTPPTGWSASTVASASEWLQSHGGNPSLVTMVFLDLIFLGLWSLAPSSGKDIFLDFSQAVVAISLGGCSAGMHAKFNGLISIGIICVYHLLSIDSAWRNIPLKVLAYGVSLITSRTELGAIEYKDILDMLDISPDVGRSWPRILLEVHIVTQGVVRVLRRSLARTSVPRSINKKSAGSSSDLAANPVSSDGLMDGARNTSSDGRQPGPSPAGRESKEKTFSSGKKRRKQATFVRSQQPFWAAIASTKVTVSKEIEQSQSSRDSFEASAKGVAQLGSASKNCFDDSVWISDVHDTDVWFSAVYFCSPARQGDPSTGKPDSRSSSSDTDSDVLVIRVNGADWTQTSTVCGGRREGKMVLTGKIFGLTPLTNYRVEFTRARDGALVQSVNLLTRPHASLDEQAPLEGTFRPSSPISTLRKSIHSQEANLAEHRNRSRKTKRDHKSSTNALRKEVDVIENRLSSWSGNDERQRQRQIQFRQNIKQAEDSFSSIKDEIENLGDVPEDEHQAAAEARERWNEEEKAYKAGRDELDNARAARERQLSAAKAEATQQQQKLDRLAARLNKLNAQRDALLAAQAQDSRNQQQRDLSRLSELQSRAEMERSYSNNVARLTNERAALLEQVTRYGQQVLFLENGYAAPPQPPPPGAFAPDAPSARSPESVFASPAFAAGAPRPAGPPVSAAPQAFALGAFAPPPQLGGRRDSQRAKTGRGRSSSMLSNVSAFTDNEIDGGGSAANGVHANGAADRQGSTGTGSGESGSAPTSRPATTSPQPKLNPIGAGRASPRNGGK